MGFRFRKTYKAGPFRVTMSKSGIGWSVGTKGFRFTEKAGGGCRTTTSIPGTGVSYTKDYSAASKAPSSAQPGDDASRLRKNKFSLGKILLIVCISCVVLQVIAVIPTMWIRWQQSSDMASTNVIQTESVWYPDSPIQFTEAPDAVIAGEQATIKIKGRAAVTYSISVLTDKGSIKDYGLISRQADLLGNTEWSWIVPDDIEPGIYYIQVSDHNGNQNRIDYAVLNEDGRVIGEPPSRDVPQESTSSELIIELEDAYVETTQSINLVYITETGSKYHKSECIHVDDSKTSITQSNAIAQGYTPCAICNP